jgi:hypothetical protein
MSTYYGYTKSELTGIIEKLHTSVEDHQDEVIEYLEATVGGRSLCEILTLDPKTGELHHHTDASFSCSEDEYYSKHGLISRRTIAQDQSCWTPGPEDGFEWEDDESGEYIGNDQGSWCVYGPEEMEREIKKHAELWEQVPDPFSESDVESVLKKNGWYRFSVDATPCDGWDMSEIEQGIESLISDIEVVIKEMDEKSDRGESLGIVYETEGE